VDGVLESVLFVGVVSQIAKHPEQADTGEVAEVDATSGRTEH